MPRKRRRKYACPFHTEDEALLALVFAAGGEQRYVRRVRELGVSALAVFQAEYPVREDDRDSLLARDADLARARFNADTEDTRFAVLQHGKRMAETGVRLLGPRDPGYPLLLQASPHRPTLLWAWGEVRDEDRYAVAILGNSRCTKYGRRQAVRFGRAAAEHGVTVVTGGEVGVDHAATQAALDAGGRVIVCLGAGIEAHGRPHHDQYRRLAESGQGAVLSVSPLDAPPTEVNQVDGDYVIAGLSIAALIVEAKGSSGAMVASRVIEQEVGRKLMALPGLIDYDESEGTNRLIADRRAELMPSPDAMLETLVRCARQLDYEVSTGQTAGRHFADAGELPSHLFRPRLDDFDRAVLDALDRRWTFEQAVAEGLDPRRLVVASYRLYLAGLTQRRYRAPATPPAGPSPSSGKRTGSFTSPGPSPARADSAVTSA